MRYFFSFFLMLFLVSGVVPALADDSGDKAAPVEFKKDKISIETADHKKIPFTVEVADTQEKRELGLQNRDKLPEDQGMLFIFDDDTYVEMWTKGTMISLDLLFLDSQGKIVYLAQKTKPDSTDVISAKREAKGVLALAAGAVAKHNIKVGDKVLYPAFEP